MFSNSIIIYLHNINISLSVSRWNSLKSLLIEKNILTNLNHDRIIISSLNIYSKKIGEIFRKFQPLPRRAATAKIDKLPLPLPYF